MAPYTRYLLASALLTVGSSAQSCPATYVPYKPLPDYPADNKCAPDNHDYELTLGPVGLEKARTECQNECTTFGDDCSSVVITLYEDKDKSSGNYDAKCLLFKEGNSAQQPGYCSRGVYCKLEGYSKTPAVYEDHILPCYSAEPEAATSYCQSVLSATATRTATVTPDVSTQIANVTLTSVQNQTAIVTRTINATTTVTATTTLFTSPTVTTNTNVVQATITVTPLPPLTASVTVTVTTTSTRLPLAKHKKRDAMLPACINKDIPASKLFSACSVYNAAPATVTTTTTLDQSVVTRTANQTLTIAQPVTATVDVTVTATNTAVVPVLITNGQTVAITTTNLNTITLPIAPNLVTTTTTFTVTSTRTVDGFTPCGLPDGYTPTGTASGTVSCTAASSPQETRSFFRIEGSIEGTIFEGCLTSRAMNITTPAGGTHLCDGTNNNVDGRTGATLTTLIASAGQQKGFGFDGRYLDQIQDFLISTISDSQAGFTRFWRAFTNELYANRTGCAELARAGDRHLWANYDYSTDIGTLKVTPGWATVTLGASVTVTVTYVNPKTGAETPFRGARIGGHVTGADGQAIIDVGFNPGCYQYKAVGNNAIRSNYFSLNVFTDFP